MIGMLYYTFIYIYTHDHEFENGTKFANKFRTVTCIEMVAKHSS